MRPKAKRTCYFVGLQAEFEASIQLMQMILQLKDIAGVHAGHPFRGSVPIAADGNALVIQMRDVSAGDAVAWPNLSRTDIPLTKSIDWLQEGDVLFTARGARNQAICLANVPPATVCAQYFFVLRAKSQQLLPAYLAWHINREPSQRYLLSNAEGSDQLSIRRGVLEDMPIALPPLARQHQIIEFAQAALQERHCLEALIQNRDQELDALAHQLLSPTHSI